MRLLDTDALAAAPIPTLWRGLVGRQRGPPTRTNSGARGDWRPAVVEAGPTLLGHLSMTGATALAWFRSLNRRLGARVMWQGRVAPTRMDLTDRLTQRWSPVPPLHIICRHPESRIGGGVGAEKAPPRGERRGKDC